jgi:hypothetical protein
MHDRKRHDEHERAEYLLLFFEATDRAAVIASHKDAPTVKLADFAAYLEDASLKTSHPINIASATVICSA